MKQTFYLLAFLFLAFLQKNEIVAQNCTAYAGEDTLVCGLQYQLIGNGYGSWIYSCDSDTISPIDFVLVDDSTANVTASAYGLHQFIFTLYQNSCSPPENTDTVLVFFYPKTIETGGGIQQSVAIEGVECPPDVTACIGESLVPIMPADADPNPTYTVTTTIDITTIYEQAEVIGDVSNCMTDSIVIIAESATVSDTSSTDIVWNGDNADEVWDELSNGFGQGASGSLNGITFPSLGGLDSLFCPANEDTTTTVDIDTSYLLLPILQTGAYWNAEPINNTPDTVFAVMYPNEFTFNLDSILIITLDSTLIATSPDIWQVDSVGALGSFEYTWVETWEYDTLWIYTVSGAGSSCPACHSGTGGGINLPPPPPPCSFTVTTIPPTVNTEYWEFCEWEEAILPDGTIISGWGGSTEIYTIEDPENCLTMEYIIYFVPYLYAEEYAEICEGETFTAWWSGEVFNQSGFYNVSVDWCSEMWLELVVLPLPTSISSTNASCGQCNGSASITVNGGAAPYSYSWGASTGNQATLINLCAGNYCVTVTDANGCMAEACVTIVDSTSPIVSFSGTDASCGQCNGSATAFANGGTPPYTYIWNDTNVQTTNTAIDLCAGEYTVTVTDANNCTVSENVVINDSESFEVIGEQVPATCGQNNGEAGVIPFNGNPPYSYQWENWQVAPVAVGLSAGTYCVTVTDGYGCAATTCIEVLEISENGETFITEEFCEGNGYELIVGTDVYDELNPAGTSILSASNDCDSIVNVNLTFNSITQNNIEEEHLSGSGYALTLDNGDVFDENNPIGTSILTASNGCDSIITVNLTFLPDANLEITSSIIDDTCGECNGEIFVNVSGGTAPYSYIWNDVNAQTTENITNLCAGNYCVTVTDMNGTTANACFTITDTPILIVDLTKNDATCGQCNGEAFANVVGGVPPYIYVWNDANAQISQDINSLCAGTYCVTVTDVNGCFDETCIEILEIGENVETFISEYHCQSDNYELIVGTDIYNELNPTGTNIFTNINNCDSIVNVNLTFYETFEQTENVTICEGEDYILPDGNVVSESGEYITTLQSENNCDSIITIILNTTTALLATPNATCAESTAESITIVWNSVENALAYIVSYENMSDTTTQTSYTIANLDAETNLNISVTAIGAGNCSISEIETISCISGQNNTNIIVPNIPNMVVFPNVFSPNDDNQNDVFRAVGRNIKSVKMLVYTRWGELVFENKTDENIDVWNGYFKNEKCEVGVYLFHATVIFEDEKIEQHKGNITLVR